VKYNDSMKIKKSHFFKIIFVGIFLYSDYIFSQECKIPKLTFQDGEKITYQTKYNWGLIWLEAGEVTFSVKRTKHRGKDAFHFVGEGGTYPKYDWIYKVRDKFESYANVENILPIRFIRDVYEGGKYFYEESIFTNDKAYTFVRPHKKELKKDTVDIEPCTFDVLSVIYHARCIDYNSYKIGDKIPINLYLDNELHEVYIRYLGKESYTTPDKKTYRCIKFSPNLIDGTIFRGGESMIVYVSDDENKVPIYVEASILVGKVKANLLNYENLKYPLKTIGQ